MKVDCLFKALVCLLGVTALFEPAMGQEHNVAVKLQHLDGRSGRFDANERVRVELTYTDVETGELTQDNFQPKGWFRLREAGDESCTGEIGLQYGMESVHLTGNLVVSLNEQATLSFVDPERKVATANTLSITRLPEMPVSIFGLAGEVYMLLAKTGAILTAAPTGETRLISTGLASPTTMAILGPNLVIADDKGLVIVSQDGKPLKHIPSKLPYIRVETAEYAKTGLQRIVGIDSKGTVVAVDPETEATLWIEAVSSNPPLNTVATNSLGVLVAQNDAASIVLRYWHAPEQRHIIQLPFVPEGIVASQSHDHAFAWSNVKRQAVAIDIKRMLISAPTTLQAPVIDAKFSGWNLFLTHANLDDVSLIDIGPFVADKLAPTVVNLPIESADPKASSTLGAFADAGQILVMPPGGNSALTFGNSQSTSHSTQTTLSAAKSKRAFVLPRGFKMLKPGVFESVARLPAHGPVELLTTTGLGGTPKCFPVDTAAPPVPEVARLERLTPATVISGKMAIVSFRLKGNWPSMAYDMPGLPVLGQQIGGMWRDELLSYKREDGTYFMEVSLPTAGQYSFTILGMDNVKPVVVEGL